MVARTALASVSSQSAAPIKYRAAVAIRSRSSRGFARQASLPSYGLRLPTRQLIGSVR